MLSAVIIDDELNGVKSLELLIEKFAPQIKVIASSNKPLEGLVFINDYKPDIVFLDINMPILNGFELLDKLTFKNFYLIFTTAHQEFGLKAIKQNATDYLLKPIGKDYLVEAIERVEKKIREKERAPDIQKLLSDLLELRHFKVPIPSKTSIDFISHTQILYMEADSRQTKVVFTGSSPVISQKALKEYESILCKNELSFIRINNSYIINLNYVTRYLKEEGGCVVMEGGKTIPVSKHKKDQFFKLINLTT